MKISYQIDEPEKVEITATITLSAADWKRLYEQIQTSSPSASFPIYKLRDVAREIWNAMNKKLESKIEME